MRRGKNQEYKDNDLTKRFYGIREVAEMLDVSLSTLRFWEKEFQEISPSRSPGNRRHYTPQDIRTLQIIRFLLKDKGLKIEAAKEQLHSNRHNISRKLKLIKKLETVKEELESLLASLVKRGEV